MASLAATHLPIATAYPRRYRQERFSGSVTAVGNTFFVVAGVARTRASPYTVRMNSHKKVGPWRRMVAFLHGGDFGIAVERLDNPELRERPVALLHSEALPLLAEVSAEARAAGLQPGMDWDSALRSCPALARVIARPSRYAARSATLLDALADISPDLEPFGPGEAFLDLTQCQAYYRHDPRRIGRLMLEAIAGAGGPSCSVGIAGDKTTARWAARQARPGAIEVIAPGEAATRLAPLGLAELCGAGPGVTDFLADHGVNCCGDMVRIPVSLAVRRFGNHGRRLWLMAQGLDPAPVRRRGGDAPALLPGLGKALPPACADLESLLGAFRQLAAKLEQRLQREAFRTRSFRIGLRAPEGWRQEDVWLDGGQAAEELAAACRRFLRRYWFGEVVRQVQLQALPERPAAGQADFFDRPRALRGAPCGRRRSAR